MPRRPEPSSDLPPQTVPRPRWLRHLAAALFLLALLPACAAGEADLNPDGSEPLPVKLSTIVEGGASIAIGSDLGTQPQLGCFRDFPGSWQMGLQARINPADAKDGYDFLPQVGLGVRKLWMGDEGAEPVRNSEYFGLALGGYFAYGFNGEPSGLKPFGTLALGKYWMPFDNKPFGLDLNLELTRYLSGHPPNRSETTFVTLGLNALYQLP